ncbi:Gfo/Idh/MocA family protein [Thalassococcus lentus]|uniref:Gfo/Idh/MocA family oxidoreductase n=1 Tax=Thalassococcus lentus TaxID=1210524 RepID=A0ABT4XXM3_9RHOB|nr:Gfo/Idh/MocA family oxidoreductase [Thalassococcus lentus]MDA7426704.1 Gfo/Idh/MocA family oxidoreductase [Thalassococcus lentus]
MQNETRIAVVGFGLIGKRHAEVLRRSPGLALAAVVDPDAESRAAAVAMGYAAFESLEQMFEQAPPDGVVLATPTPMHLEQGLCCIANNCPVLIEKPIAVTAAEAEQLTVAAEQANVALLVGHHRRHNGMVRAAKAAIDNGSIGSIRAVQATCWFYKPDYYFDAAPWRKHKGAGPISVNLVHDVDLLRHFCGEVRSVQAIAVPSARGFENEDLATAILTFEQGCVATISVSDSIVAPWSWELTSCENPAYPATNESCYLIGGSEGGLSLPDLRVWRHEETQDWWTPIGSQTLLRSFEDPLATQMHHFAQVIQGKCQPLVSGVEGMRSLEVVEAIAISAATGDAVSIQKSDAQSREPAQKPAA